MKILSVVLAIDDEIERVRMFNLLRDEGQNVIYISPNSLLNAKLTLPALIITDTTHDGIGIVDIIANLVDLHDDLAVIFVLPRLPGAPHWGDQFIGKKVSFFTFGYIDKEFLSFVHRFSDNLGWKMYEPIE